MEPPRSHYQHLYTVNKQWAIPLLCLNWCVLACEPIKQIDAFHALTVMVEAERLNTSDLFFTLAVAFHHFGKRPCLSIALWTRNRPSGGQRSRLLFFNTFWWSQWALHCTACTYSPKSPEILSSESRSK